MSPAPSARPFWKVIDWRLVAACGLPAWAFLFGMILGPRPVRVAQAAPEPPQVIEPASPAEAPMPHEVVFHESEPVVVSVPLVVPVPVPGETVVAAPVENQLPASELLPADRCKTFDTRLSFHPTMADAADEARRSKKLLFVLHISGEFDDPGFT